MTRHKLQGDAGGVIYGGEGAVDFFFARHHLLDLSCEEHKDEGHLDGRKVPTHTVPWALPPGHVPRILVDDHLCAVFVEPLPRIEGGGATPGLLPRLHEPSLSAFGLHSPTTPTSGSYNFLAHNEQPKCTMLRHYKKSTATSAGPNLWGSAVAAFY